MPIVDLADPSCPLPQILVFDASILLELHVSPVRKQGVREEATRRFLQRVGDEVLAQRMLCVAPVSTLDECYFRIIGNQYELFLKQNRQRLKKQIGRNLNWRKVYKAKPDLILNYMPLLREFRAAVQGIPVLILNPDKLASADLGIDPPELEARMFHYIEAVPIEPRDAYLLAVAERLNAPHVATLDSDFYRAENWLHVYTVQ